MNRQERRLAARVRDVQRTAAPRRGVGNPIEIALFRAAKPQKQEIAEIIDPARKSLDAMRQGVGQLADWQALATAVNISNAIERQGIVRGLSGHIRAAEEALATIHRRAEEDLSVNPQTPHPYALFLGEIEVLTTAIELLFDYQLRHLSRSEMNRAIAYAINEVRSTGGEVIDNRSAHFQASLPLTVNEGEA